MTDYSHIERFIGVFFAGLGMVLIGGLNLALVRSRLRVRVLASVAVAGAVLGAYAAWQSNAAAVQRVAGMLGLALVPAVLLGSRSLIKAGTATVGFLGRPAARWGLVAAAGVVTIVAGSLNFSRSEEAAHDQGETELELLVARPELSEQGGVHARTDRGYALPMRRPVAERGQSAIDDPEDRVLTKLGCKDYVIRRQPATDISNCHGWVFTGGRYWVGGDSVGQILADNGYAAVTDPRPGDLAIYRDGQDAVSHTAVVRYATEGMTPLVESKWSWMGVFLHPVDKSVYGTNFTFYRSPRAGHVIAGLDNPKSNTE